MSEVKDYVVINITRESARVTRPGFGTPLLFGGHYHLPPTTRVYTYTDPADMLDDGFLTTDDLYIAALKLMSQELSPESFKIARKLEDVNSKASLAFTGTPSAGTWTLTIGIADATPVESGAITYAADNDCATIKSVIEAMTGITTVTVTGLYSTGYTIEFTGVDAAHDFRVTAINVASLTGVTAATVTQDQYGSATEAWDVGLAAVIAEDNDWYSLVATTRTKADILLLAAAIESADIKTYFACTGEADVKNGVASNTLLSLKALAYDRTAYLFSEDYANFPEAAWLGGQLPKNPGSITWKFKTLIGITPDTLTATQFGNIKNNYGNTYETVGGVNIISSEAQVVSGEYIDIIRGTDWLQVNMQTELYTLLISSDKIPMTERGAGAIQSKIEYWLGVGESQAYNLLVPGASVVNVPKVSELPLVDRTARFYSGITFSSQYAGAVHKIGITGKLTV
jgi:hypothetical protein